MNHSVTVSFLCNVSMGGLASFFAALNGHFVLVDHINYEPVTDVVTLTLVHPNLPLSAGTPAMPSRDVVAFITGVAHAA